LRGIGASSYTLLIFIVCVGAFRAEPHAGVVDGLPVKILASGALDHAHPCRVICKPRSWALRYTEVVNCIPVPESRAIPHTVPGGDISIGIVRTFSDAYSSTIVSIPSGRNVAADENASLCDIVCVCGWSIRTL
jgi:hypothetical protein